VARKSVAQHEQERLDAERRVWDTFRPRFEKASTFREAGELAEDPYAPQSGAPGRKYFSNLAFFLGSFSPPGGASGTELRLYIAFLRKIEKELKPGFLPGLIHALEAEIGKTDRYAPEP